MAEEKSGSGTKQKNCTACGKPVKKLKRYYTAGKYYCSRKCYRRFKESQRKKNA